MQSQYFCFIFTGVKSFNSKRKTSNKTPSLTHEDVKKCCSVSSNNEISLSKQEKFYLNVGKIPNNKFLLKKDHLSAFNSLLITTQ